MFRILSLFLLLATTSSAQAQQYWQRICTNGKCEWVLVNAAPQVEAQRVRTPFRSVLLKASEEAYKESMQLQAEGKEGRLSRLDMLKIRVFCLSPKRVAQLEAAVADQLVLEGQVASINAIDWDKLIGIIKDLLPIILEIIKLISSE